MKIEKVKLLRICIIAFVAIVIGVVAYNVVDKKQREEQRANELNDAIDKMQKDIYDDLLRDYKYYIDQALDYEYSYSYRERAVKKLNKLLGKQYFDNCSDIKLLYGSPKTDKKALELLEQRATLKLAEKLFE